MTLEEIAEKKENNPRWHKPVKVNKVERKKFHLVKIFKVLKETVVLCKNRWGQSRFGIFYSDPSSFPLGPGKVIFNDCSHLTFRYMRKTAHGYRMITERDGVTPRIFHSRNFR